MATNSKANDATWYTEFFARDIWAANAAGSKPSLADLKAAHHFGRPGKQSLALAMAMRPAGATGGEIQLACGAPQNNHRTKLVRAGLFKRVPHPARGTLTVYKIELTDKGRKALGSAVQPEPAKAAKPEKAKPAKAAKPKAPKAPKVGVNSRLIKAALDVKAAKAEPAKVPEVPVAPQVAPAAATETAAS